MSGMTVFSSNPTYATGATAPSGNATGNPNAQPPKVGFFARLADRFASIGLGMGFGPEAREIKNAFRRLDGNNDHNLDANEFGVVGNAFGQGTAAFGMAGGSDGRVSLGEFKSWIRGSTQTEFRRIDTNADGALDANEFSSVQATNPGLSLAGMDTNNDQLVTFREYLRFRVTNFLHH